MADIIAEKKLILACLFALLFMFAEIIGGYLSGSLAIVSDAAHLLSDVTGFMISLFSIWIRKLPTSQSLSYGFYRVEVIGAICSIFLVWFLTIWLVCQAVQRLILEMQGKNNEILDGKLMFIIALVGLFVNLCLMRILGHSHTHNHNHSHHHCHGTTSSTSPNSLSPSTIVSNHKENILCNASFCSSESQKVIAVQDAFSKSSYDKQVNADELQVELSLKIQKETKKEHIYIENINLRAAYIHALGDFLQSIGVCVAGALIWYNPKWKIIDPVLTFIFAILVLITTIGVFKTSIFVLLEGTPSNFNYGQILKELSALDDVESVHDLHIWSITVGTPSLSVHIVTREHEKTLVTIQKYLLSIGIVHSTIQIETSKVNYPRDCSQLYCGQQGNSSDKLMVHTL